MRLQRIFFFFIILTIFVFSNLFAIDLKLIKKETVNSVDFFYRFSDSANREIELVFELSRDLVRRSAQDIPSLALLHQKIHTELPSLAYKIAAEQLTATANEYYRHVTDIEHTVWQAKRNLGQNFELAFQCPEQILVYDLEFTKDVKFSYHHILKMQSCSFEFNTKKAYADLLKDIKQKIQQTKKILINEVIYEVQQTEDGFKIYYEIPAGLTKQQGQKIINSIEKTQKTITNIQALFNQKQEKLKVHFQELVQSNKDFLAIIKRSQKDLIKNIAQALTNKQEEEYYKYYLKITKNNQGHSIHPDYERLVKKYQPLMHQVAFSVDDSSLSQRQLANKLLNFLQAIPYDDLKQRDLEYFAGFITPPILFAQNKGDCDSKSVAFLAIAKNLFSNTRGILVLIANHAFVGLELQPQGKEQVLEHNGIAYVLAEVVGPAILSFGVIGTRSKAAIKKKEIEEIITF